MIRLVLESTQDMVAKEYEKVIEIENLCSTTQGLSFSLRFVCCLNKKAILTKTESQLTLPSLFSDFIVQPANHTCTFHQTYVDSSWIPCVLTTGALENQPLVQRPQPKIGYSQGHDSTKRNMLENVLYMLFETGRA
jgi:hypothetical protein